MWWKSKEAFAADARRADDSRLREMLVWALAKENEADAPGMGRSKKARSHFRAMHLEAVAELDRRGLND